MALPVYEKWLIYEALANDKELARELASLSGKNVAEPLASFDEEKAMYYLDKIDQKIARGEARLLEADEVIEALKKKRHAV